jgi:hypothetical protein
MILQKKFINLFFILLFLLIFIILKNYPFCDIFSDCSLTQEIYGGDLSKYVKHYYSNVIINNYNIGTYVIFKLFHTWASFGVFLIIFQLSFYSVIFFSAVNLTENENLTKFSYFTLIVAFYPFYDGYSSIAIKQGLGMIFLFASLFLVKRVFSLTSCIFIILAILNHLVFLLFYLIFWISRFFSLKFLTILYFLVITIYLTNINDPWYAISINFLYNLDLFFIADEILSSFNPETKLRFVLFSSLPLFSLLIPKFKKLVNENELLKNLYQYHFLYSSTVYLILSEFFYIDRFLSLTWIFYPFYLLYLLRIVKFNKT